MAAAVAIPGLELLEPLGSGAQGAVFRARRGAQYYAVKLPLKARSDQTVVRRFMREAVALARIRHPVLPEVLDVGEIDGVPYIVMELAAGEPLADRLRGRPLSKSDVLRIGRELADALDAIHRGGLVHRDVKPGNIMVDASTGAVRLVDFGFAVPLDPERQSTHAAGTRNYIAPEQLAGDGRVDGRADLYSLGCVLYECLHGQPPARDPGRTRTGARRSVDAGRAFDELLERLLARSPDERPPTAASVSLELAALARGDEEVVRRRAHTGVPLLPGAHVPLLGREHEIERLRRTLIDSRAKGRQIAFIRGPGGSGKSRLAQELVEEALALDFAVLATSCADAAPEPFSAIRQMLEARLEMIERKPAAERLREIAALREIAGEVAPLLKLVSPRMARLFPDAARMPRSEDVEHIAAEALSDFCAKVVRALGPTLVLIDDAQWLDSGSRRVLVKLVDRLAGERVLVLFVVRSGVGDRGIERMLQSQAVPAVELELGPLREADLALLARAYLGGASLSQELVTSVLQLGDGMPLSLIELLRAMLESGVLAPHWGRWRLDVSALTAMQLPRRSVELLAQRIEQMDEMSRAVLTAAAVLGMRFEDGALQPISGLDAGVVHEALGAARRDQLVTPLQFGTHEFVHASVREALLDGLPAPERCALNQRAAEALQRFVEADGGSEVEERSLVLVDTPEDPFADYTGAERWFAIAAHYAQGDLSLDPQRAYEASVRAGKLAFRAFDGTRAIAFWETAERAAALHGTRLPPELQFLIGEAHFRVGRLNDSVKAYGRAVTETDDPLLQTLAYSRMAWVQMLFDEPAAWDSLGRAFGKLGERTPDDTLSGLLRSVVRWVIGRIVPRRLTRDRVERHRLEALASTNYQALRLAVQGARPVRSLQVALSSIAPAERLGPSAGLAKIYFGYSFLLTALGFRKRGRFYLEQAEQIARDTRDPVVYAHALAIRYTVAAWAGDLADSVRAAARSLDEYGHWRELTEYCLVTDGIQQILSLQGRNQEAWYWVERAIRKIAQHEGAPIALEAFEASARAALISLGREDEAASILALIRSRSLDPNEKAPFGMPVHGARARQFTEGMTLGDDFEQFVAEVRAKGENPRRVHMGATDYYVHVAYARVHECLRADGDERAAKLSELGRAVRDVRLAARVPLLVAHSRALDAYDAWFRGNVAQAERLFEDAERIAVQENAPWVLYAVHRGRAHMLKAADKLQSARDQAKLAEALAREHGAAHRVRWVREEFGLPATRRLEPGRSSLSLSLSAGSSENASSQTAVRARGYLRALRRITQASTMELEPKLQSRMVLDEIVQALRADRGLLLLSPFDETDVGAPPVTTASALELSAARDGEGSDLPDPEDHDRLLVDEALAVGLVVTGERGMRGRSVALAAATSKRSATIAAPLLVRGTTVGAVYLERAMGRGAFAETDAEVLAALAAQVPVALELARLLYMRERAAENLRTVQKMQAVARLAGGVAHDFNNLLQTIEGTTVLLLEDVEEARQRDDLQAIRDIVVRARGLTQQLLSFSRGGAHVRPEVLDIQGELVRMRPVLTKLLGERVKLELSLGEPVGNVRLDPTQLDQVMTNLVGNARDAIDGAGEVRIETRTVRLDEAYARERPGVEPGDYVVITVADTGTGMDEEVRARIFEPYFTTKSRGRGTGLGLAIVYGAVTQSGGHIDVESSVGVGTTFRLFLPRTSEKATERRALPALRQRAAVVTGKVLVVDDEVPVLQTTCRMLELCGYETLCAGSGDEALAIATERGHEIAVLVTDVQMPKMDGITLAEQITQIRPTLPIVFVSGGSDERLRAYGLNPDVDCLTKPLFREVLDRKIREVVAAGEKAS